MVAADDITRGKPDPEPFPFAAAKLASTRSPAWSSRTLPRPRRLRAASMRTVALATTHDRSWLDADVVVTDLSEVFAQATDGGVEATAGV